jgi:hypothetical protein
VFDADDAAGADDATSAVGDCPELCVSGVT